MMSKGELDRFNTLSGKALKNTATQNERLEYKKLLLSWNSSMELKSLQNFYAPELNN